MHGLTHLCALGCLWGCDVYHADRLRRRPADRPDAAQIEAGVDTGPASAMTDMTEQPPSRNAATPVECGRGKCWWSHTQNGCESAGRPGPQSRPGSSPATTTPISEGEHIYLGFTQIQMTATENELSFGLDLDNVCSNSPTCRAQQTTSCKSQTPQMAFDADNCSDNTFSRLMAMLARIPEVADRLGLRDSAVNCELWRGGYNVLVRLIGYDGSADDPSVRVDWYTSNGLEQLPDWRCPESDFETKHARWPSGARWNVDARELTGTPSERDRLPTSKISDPDAYVRGGYLVSRLPDGALLRFAGDAKPLRGLALPVHDTLWLGRLIRSADRSWTIKDGLIAGRARTDELLRSFRQAGLCKTGGAGTFFDAIETYVRESADVLANGASAPGQACDAISFGIAFRAAQITPGDARNTLEPLIECCEPGRSYEECEPRCGDGKVSGGEGCDIAIVPGQIGACPTQCSPSRACATATLEGAGCEARCVEYPFQASVPGDGCCPDGATSRADPDCPPKCGNGVLEAGETCDPPSSCASCIPEDKCLRTTTTGSADTCDVVCNVTAISECRSEDGCCPERCTRGADNDCTTSCGNGSVDPGTTETCERGSPTPCARSCDDSNPCTTDIATGSTENCNVRCSHFLFGALGASDGCCPSGADANVDPDC